jgi:hypothetical protein
MCSSSARGNDAASSSAGSEQDVWASDDEGDLEHESRARRQQFYNVRASWSTNKAIACCISATAYNSSKCHCAACRLATGTAWMQEKKGPCKQGLT